MTIRKSSLSLSLAMIGSLMWANASLASVWTGDVDDAWETADNWDTGVPDANSMVSIFALAGGTTVHVNSPTAAARDISLDSTTADDVSLIIESGATLTVSQYNVDLGYTGGSTGHVLLHVKNGGTLNVPGYLGLTCLGKLDPA